MIRRRIRNRSGRLIDSIIIVMDIDSIIIIEVIASIIPIGVGRSIRTGSPTNIVCRQNKAIWIG